MYESFLVDLSVLEFDGYEEVRDRIGGDCFVEGDSVAEKDCRKMGSYAVGYSEFSSVLEVQFALFEGDLDSLCNDRNRIVVKSFK